MHWVKHWTNDMPNAKSIEVLAKEVGFDNEIIRNHILKFEKLSEFISHHERERCAQICESYGQPFWLSQTAIELSKSIRSLK